MNGTASPSSLPNVRKEEEDGCSTIIVNSRQGLESVVEELARLPPKPPSIYLDAVGSGTDQLVELQLLIPPKTTLYVIKMKRLAAASLSADSNSRTSLRHILESESVPKVGFDIRGISRILFHQYNVVLGGMYDLQLMELASRGSKLSKKYLAGLTKCVDQDIPSTKTTKSRWLQPGDTSNMHLFNSLGHVSRDTMMRIERFPPLWAVYRRKLGRPGQAFWLNAARYYSGERVRDSKNTILKNERQSIGPEMFWNHKLRQEAIDDWDDEILMEKNAGYNRLDDDANWVPIR
ncbi:hypothetical protein BKA56DRAFT_592731 [Ilyonectria sp. MPI-CAGE-AT-0026]|nr:hypothetical protein BKA56DRAFT_592731 [Ilyonectria sp. MPI-CAGE-AT-0026]